jgi:Predicted aminopeptidases
MMKFKPTVKSPKTNKGEKQKIDELGNRLKDHVTFLAGTIGERNLFIHDNLHKAAFYIYTFWQNLGYEVKKQAFLVKGLSCENLSIEIPGKEKPEEIILFGAHYDSVIGSPGANDNGSAVASLLEISRLFSHTPQKKTVRLVAFTNEEPPFFQKKSMGSRVYAQRCRKQKEKIIAMVSLETIGYYSEVRKSQKYPLPLNFFYPDKGNFLGVVGNIQSRKLVKTFTQYFMEGVDSP